MDGRIDVARRMKCPNCFGTTKDPKKRSRKCSRCMGYGKVWSCLNCNCMMPCPGTDTNMFDQSSCNLPKRPIGDDEFQC